MTYEPVSLLTVDRTIPVSVCVAVMSAPGKTAPLASLTVPLICAVACARALTQPRMTINSTIAEYFARHFIDSSPEWFSCFEKQWRQFIQSEDSDQLL